MFLDHAVTTWAGGSGAWRLADWEPLAGRDVLLLADADDPGREAMRCIAEHLMVGGCTVRIHLPTGDDGRDIADSLDCDSPERTRQRIEANAKVWEPKADVTADAGDSESWQEDLIERYSQR